MLSLNEKKLLKFIFITSFHTLPVLILIKSRENIGVIILYDFLNTGISLIPRHFCFLFYKREKVSYGLISFRSVTYHSFHYISFLLRVKDFSKSWRNEVCQKYFESSSRKSAEVSCIQIMKEHSCLAGKFKTFQISSYSDHFGSNVKGE